MFHFISSYDLVETEVYHQKFSFTRKWEDCGGLSDCEELVRGLVTRNNGVKFIVGIAAYSIADCIS